MHEAKIVNNIANGMLTNPGNLGLRPAPAGAAPSLADEPRKQSAASCPGGHRVSRRRGRKSEGERFKTALAIVKRFARV